MGRGRILEATLALCLASVATSAGGCAVEPGTAYVHIDHYRQPCADAAAAFCFRVLEHDLTQTVPLQSIDGFEYRWGTVYELLVAPSPEGNGEARLVEVLAQTAVTDDAAFELELSPQHVLRVDERELKLSDAISAACADPAVCLEVARALSNDEVFAVEFRRDGQEDFVAHHVRTRS